MEKIYIMIEVFPSTMAGTEPWDSDYENGSV
jgi:hypothetical protein